MLMDNTFPHSSDICLQKQRIKEQEGNSPSLQGCSEKPSITLHSVLGTLLSERYRQIGMSSEKSHKNDPISLEIMTYEERSEEANV